MEGGIAKANCFEAKSADGLILKSPSGKRFKITVADDGTISSEELV